MVAFIRAAQRIEPFFTRALTRERKKALRRRRQMRFTRLPNFARNLNVCSCFVTRSSARLRTL